jgi:hypothetical protein
MLRGERKNWHAFVTSGDQARNQVGGAWTRVAQHDRDFSSRFVEALGHVHACGFMPDWHETDVVRV